MYSNHNVANNILGIGRNFCSFKNCSLNLSWVGCPENITHQRSNITVIVGMSTVPKSGGDLTIIEATLKYM